MLHNHIPIWFHTSITLLVISAIPISYYLFVNNEKILNNFIIKNKKFYNFFLNKWYFDELYELIFVKPLKVIGTFFWHQGDIKTIDRYGPDGFSRLIKMISDRSVIFQSGYMYHYAFIMLIGLTILLTYLIIF
jgi:NADH-quinone oxidoreductase subunit L